MKILIVDDEHLARERLRDLLTDLDPAHELYEADNGLAALQQVQAVVPDLVLLDIRMPVMDGLEAAGHLLQVQPAPAVVFTSAYQDHAIKAFELHAVDYLLKPIRRDRLKDAVERCRLLQRSRLEAVVADGGQRPARSHLSASTYGKITLIPLTAVRYLKADQKYVAVGWNGRETLINESLKSLEQEYGDRFLRIHRNALIARDAVRSLEKDNEGGYLVYLHDFQYGLPVSRRHLHDVRQTLKQMG